MEVYGRCCMNSLKDSGDRVEKTTRRAFMQFGAASLIALDRMDPFIAGPKSLVVDTHLHCFAGAKDPRFPYHARAPYRPEPAAPPEHLLRCMEGARVDHAIVVHPEP